MNSLVREMVPDDLKCFDGVLPRFAFTFCEHREHRGFIQHCGE
jgi:hypothetical protein